MGAFGPLLIYSNQYLSRAAERGPPRAEPQTSVSQAGPQSPAH